MATQKTEKERREEYASHQTSWKFFEKKLDKHPLKNPPVENRILLEILKELQFMNREEEIIITGKPMEEIHIPEKVTEKRFFITRDPKPSVRWVKVFINKNITWDNGETHLVVSMSNSLNQAHRVNDVQVESIFVKDCFATQLEAEQEIIRRERFGK